MRRLIPILCGFILTGPSLAEDRLTEAFLGQCEHLMNCALESAAKAGGDLDHLNMIKTHLTRQCQTQVDRLERPAPESVREIVACLDAMAELSCDDIEAKKTPAACRDLSI